MAVRAAEQLLSGAAALQLQRRCCASRCRAVQLARGLTRSGAIVGMSSSPGPLLPGLLFRTVAAGWLCAWTCGSKTCVGLSAQPPLAYADPEQVLLYHWGVLCWAVLHQGDCFPPRPSCHDPQPQPPLC
jgi:hypothetical protein